MRKEYRIKKVDLNGMSEGGIWESVPAMDIECYPWKQNSYTPKVSVKVFYTPTHFHVKFYAVENEIKVEYKNMNDPVCQDSCVEFFINPNPEKDDRYLNFEVNPIGTMLLGLGKGRHGRALITDRSDFDSFAIKTSVKPEEAADFSGDCWSVEYAIPFRFIEKIYGRVAFDSGKRISANFYKCGDYTRYPHYGCWNEIVSEKPDFHRPECFGELVLE